MRERGISEAVVEHLHRHGASQVREIAEAIGRDGSNVQASLSYLLHRGEVQRVGRGRYRLAGGNGGPPPQRIGLDDGPVLPTPAPYPPDLGPASDWPDVCAAYQGHRPPQDAGAVRGACDRLRSWLTETQGQNDPVRISVQLAVTHLERALAFNDERERD